MNSTKIFLNYLDMLKTDENSSLIEAIASGYNVINETALILESTDVMFPDDELKTMSDADALAKLKEIRNMVHKMRNPSNADMVDKYMKTAEQRLGPKRISMQPHHPLYILHRFK